MPLRWPIRPPVQNQEKIAVRKQLSTAPTGGRIHNNQPDDEDDDDAFDDAYDDKDDDEDDDDDDNHEDKNEDVDKEKSGQ